jgi:DNA polymerase III epsilon subunit-like protein
MIRYDPIDRWVVYDLEFVGARNAFKECRIWDVGARVLDAAEVFRATCVPCLPIPPPVSSEYAPITKAWLRTQPGFSRKRKCLISFLRWLRLHAGQRRLVLVSHGGADKVVLEAELDRHKLKLPPGTRFFDTLPLFRTLLPGAKAYTLGALAHLLYEGAKLEHRALGDADVLARCLGVVGLHNLQGCSYGAGCRPLQSLRGVGSGTERRLIACGVIDVADLARRCASEPSFLAGTGLTPQQTAAVTQALAQK